jgi:hypothetical protein
MIRPNPVRAVETVAGRDAEFPAAIAALRPASERAATTVMIKLMAFI